MSEVGRYSIYGHIAQGGMATVHLGRLKGAAGFERTVAIKRLHPQYATDSNFVGMFTDEARLASRIQHPNVVATLDVVQEAGELFLVLEYIHGETLDRLVTRRFEDSEGRVPPEVAVAIMVGALRGLHAAHEATNARGEPLCLVHRDISPHNIIVGTDGVPRVLDFGIAKAAGRSHCTQDGFVKGKIAYMPAEQLFGEQLDRRADVYAAGVVLWEMLTGQRLFAGKDFQPALLKRVDPICDAPSARVRARCPEAIQDLGKLEALDSVVLKALEEDPADRFDDALSFARAIEARLAPVHTARVADWMYALASESLEKRAVEIQEIEREACQSLWDIDGTDPELLSRVRAGQLPPAYDSTRMGIGPTVTERRYTGPGATQLLPPDGVSEQLPADSTLIKPGESTDTSSSQTGAWVGHPEVRPRLSWARGVALIAGGAVAVSALVFGRALFAQSPDLDGFPAANSSAEPLARIDAWQQLGAAAPSQGDAGTVDMAPVFVSGADEAAGKAGAELASGQLLAEESSDRGGQAEANAQPATNAEASAKAASAANQAAPGTARPAAKAQARHSTPVKSAATKANCAQPFVIDAQGHKLYKRECF